MVTIDNSRLYEAFDIEAKEVDVATLMEQMMASFNAEKEYQPTPIDEIRIRKMMLARSYLTKEQDHLTLLKKAIVSEWDERINKKKAEITEINNFIEMYLKNHNQGKKLSLDVGTANLTRTGPKAVLDTQKMQQATDFLRAHNVLEQYQKAPELDVTLLQNAYVKEFKDHVEKEAAKRVKAIIEESGKITKKREGEIALEVEQELAEGYFTKLPDFMQYVPEKKSLSIKMK